MIEMLTVNPAKKSYDGWGPWPKPSNTDLSDWYETPDGFAALYKFQTYSSFDLQTQNLINLCGLNSTMKPMVINPLWRKFYLDGWILYTPVFPIGNGSLWEEIFAAGCGDGQKVISYGGATYAVELWSIKKGNGTITEQTLANRATPGYSSGSDYNRTLLNLCNDTPLLGDREPGTPAWGANGNGGNITSAVMMGKNHNIPYNSYTWMRNYCIVDGSGEGGAQRPALNVSDNVAYTWYELDNPQFRVGRTWRPVLRRLT